MKSQLLRPVSASAWLAALASPENRVEIDFHGVPGFYNAKRGWMNQPRPFGQHLLYYVVNGSFRVRKATREYTVEPGMLLWICPWTEFRCWLPGDKPVRFYRFRLRLETPRGEALSLRKMPFVIRGLGSARRWFDEILRATGRGGGSLGFWRLRAALLGLFAEAQSSKTPPAQRGRLRQPQMEALEELAHRDGKVQATPARLAAHLGLSTDYFTRLFRKTYGIPPRAWMVRERIKMAAVRLLESHLNVGEVAEEFGYRDIFFFSRQFKQVMGQSPKLYRRTMAH